MSYKKLERPINAPADAEEQEKCACVFYRNFIYFGMRYPLIIPAFTRFFEDLFKSRAIQENYQPHPPICLNESNVLAVQRSDNFLWGVEFVARKLFPPIFFGLLVNDIYKYRSSPQARVGNSMEKTLVRFADNQSVLTSQWPSSWAWTPAWLGGMAFFGLVDRYLKYRSASTSEELRRLNWGTKTSWPIIEELLVCLPFSRYFSKASKEMLKITQRITLVKDKPEQKLLLDGVRKKLNVERNPPAYNKTAFLRRLIKYAGIEVKYAGIEVKYADENDNDNFTAGPCTKFVAMRALAKIAEEFRSHQLKDLSESDIDDCIRLRKDAIGALQIAAKDKSFCKLIKKTYANYLLWKSGFKRQFGYEMLFVPAACICSSVMIYSDYRLILSLLQRSIKGFTFAIKQGLCHKQEKVYTYMQHSGKHECTVCGDWPDVYYKDTFDAQRCIDGLLRKNQSPATIIQALKRVLPFGISHIDFSQQNWQKWPEEEMRTILDLIRQVSNGALEYFDLSSQILEPEILSQNKTDIVVSAFKQMDIAAIDFSNNWFPVNGTAQIITNCNGTEWLNISKMRLGREDISSFAKALTFSNVTNLIAGGNHFDNYCISILSPVLHSLHLTELDLSRAVFDETGISYLSADEFPYLEKINLSDLEFSSNDLTAIQPLMKNSNLQVFFMRASGINDQNLPTFIYALSESNVREVYLDGNQITAVSGSVLGFAAQNSTVQVMSLSGNPLSDLGVVFFAQYWPETNLREVGLGNVNLGDAGAKFVCKIMPQTTIVRVNFSDNQITWRGAKYCAPIFADTNVTDIIFNNNVIEDSGLHAFIKPVQKSKALRHLGLAGTGITRVSNLFKILKYVSSFEELNLKGNKLIRRDYIAAMNELSSTHLTWLNLENTEQTLQVGDVIADQLPGSKITWLDVSDNPALGNTFVVKMAQQLTTANPGAKQLMSPKRMRDEMRVIHHAKPATNLEVLGLRDVNIFNEAARAICRVLPSTKIDIRDLWIDDNLINPDKINLFSCDVSSASRIKLPAIFNLPTQMLKAILQFSQKLQLMFFQSQILDMQPSLSSSAVVPFMPLKLPKVAMECIIQGRTLQCRGFVSNAHGEFDYFYIMADVIQDQMRMHTLLLECAAAFIFAFRNNLARLAKPYLPRTFVSLYEHYCGQKESILINAGAGMILRGKCNTAAVLTHDVTYAINETVEEHKREQKNQQKNEKNEKNGKNGENEKPESLMSKAAKVLLTFGGGAAASYIVGLINPLAGVMLFPVFVKAPKIYQRVSDVYNNNGFFAAVDEAANEVSFAVPGGEYVKSALAQ